MHRLLDYKKTPNKNLKIEIKKQFRIYRVPIAQALSAQSVNTIIKSVAKMCGIPEAESYSSHSLRRGFATTASQQGATLGSIMRQGRWRNETTVHGYIQEGEHNIPGDAFQYALQSLA